MGRQVIQLERLDVGERPRRLETGHGGNCRVRSDIDENALAGQHARSAVVEMHLARLRRHKAPVAHDQLGTRRLVVATMRVDLPLDHVAFAFDDNAHVNRDRAGHDAESCAMACEMRDLGAPDLVLARQAGDVGTGAADPATLDHGSPPSRFRHVPGQQLAALAAAQHQDVELFRLRHNFPQCVAGGRAFPWSPMIAHDEAPTAVVSACSYPRPDRLRPIVDARRIRSTSPHPHPCAARSRSSSAPPAKR